ncbi:hypothetical protein EQG49_03100 [Periweissella cryptocerci]|uniref:YdbS-like PH domain-containing protein n=1 Tax=Periweissella cryptocerci TaxID=2506420 RepID=A0A4P6YSC5_9LACO|nr:PH domain-containing protein [Periweissella cryptocerci]QBO35513.1 hypothetical protein EQG49_03100 [Periweissella cryptocerci]
MPRHQHFLTLVLTILRSTFNILIALLILIKFTTHLSGWLWLLLIIVLGVVLPSWQYMLNRYTFTANDVHLQSGLFWKKDVHIPYERIQTIQRKQSLLYQIFRLARVTIDTSGKSSGEAEAVLPGVKLSVADELELLRAQHHQAPVTPVVLWPQNIKAVPVSQPNYTISPKNLFIYGLTSLGILPILIGVWFVYDQIGDLLPKRYAHWLVNNYQHGTWQVLLAVILLIFILAALINLVKTVNKYYGFNITRTDHAVELQRGLINHATVHFDTRKVQAVQFEQSLLRRAFHLVTVKVLLASNAADDESEAELTMIPVIPMKSLTKVMPSLLPDFDYGIPQQFTSLPNERFWYFWRIRLWWLLLVPGIEALWLWHYQLLAIITLIVLIAWFTSLAWFANHDVGLAIMADQLLLQKARNFKKTWTLVKHVKIQSLAINQSLWLINSDIAHLSVDVRAANSSHSIDLRYLNLADTLAVQKWYTTTSLN